MEAELTSDASSGEAVYVLMPAQWTDANLTFQVSSDDNTFWDLFDEHGKEVTLTCKASTAVRIQAAGLKSIGYFRLRSGTRDAPVVQTENRNFKIIF